MKLASLKNETRDGMLVVVSRDLTSYTAASSVAKTLQQALDNWAECEPKLQNLYRQLNAGQGKYEPFNALNAKAPLPRAYQWCDGSAYLSHMELVRKARGAEMPPNFYQEPLLYQGGSDVLIGAHDDISVADEAWGIDLEAEIGVILDDVKMGTSIDDAEHHIKLLVLINDVSLRNVMRDELAKGFGFFQSKPSTAFGPIAITPDELGDAWNGKRLSASVMSFVNGKLIGRPDTSVDLSFDFPTLISHAALTRDLGAGTIVGSGTISNRDPSLGSSCLQEMRMSETLKTGAPVTPFLKFGDSVRIEAVDRDGETIFGAINQRIVGC